MPHCKIQPSRCRQACKVRDMQRIGASKRQKLFEQTEVGIALVCGEAGNDASGGIIACGFGRNSRRLVSTYNQGSPCGKLVSFARKRRKIWLKTRVYVLILFPHQVLPYEKSLYVRTSFSIRFCLREQ